jgi:hypothetical protein
MTNLTFGYIGHSGEKSTASFPVPELTAANIESYTDGGLSTAFDALKDAVAAITLMNFIRHTATAQIAAVPEVLPASVYAQRERGLLVLMADPGGHKSRIVIPGPDATLLAQSGNDDVDLAGTEMAALVTAIETYCVDPITKLAVTVYAAKLVGRNN